MSHATWDYWTYRDYIPHYICDELIKNHDNFDHGTLRGGTIDEDMRRSGVCWVSSPFWVNLFFDIILRANQESQLNYNIVGVEDLQLTRYVAPDGHYDFHIDGDGHTRKNADDVVRKLSMSCLLTDPKEFEGGKFQCQNGAEPYDVELNKGDIVIFPSYTLHRVSPVTKGERYSLVAWANGKAFT